MLGILGLDEQTERVYRELVQLGPCTVEALAVRLGLKRGPVAESIASLETKSLATRDAGGLVHTAPPQLALGALLTAQRHALGQAELTAAALAEAYHAASAQNAHELVQVVIGAEQVRQRLEHIQHNAEAELLAFVQARIEVPEACESEAETSAVQRGVRYRVVMERSLLEGPHSVKPGTEEELRVVEALPTKLIIVDRSTVMLPLSSPAAAQRRQDAAGQGAAGEDAAGQGSGRRGSAREDAERQGSGRQDAARQDAEYVDDGPMALISRAPGLVAAMTGLFESIWQRALPVRPAGDEAAEPKEPLPTPLDLRILSLLLVGATDAAIAKQLGLGLRTVQRRVAHMMELAEVSTRLQLGWQAHDRGWLK